MIGENIGGFEACDRVMQLVMAKDAYVILRFVAQSTRTDIISSICEVKAVLLRWRLSTLVT